MCKPTKQTANIILTILNVIVAILVLCPLLGQDKIPVRTLYGGATTGKTKVDMVSGEDGHIPNKGLNFQGNLADKQVNIDRGEPTEEGEPEFLPLYTSAARITLWVLHILMFALALTTVLVLQCVKTETGAKIWLPFITGFICFAAVITFLFFLPSYLGILSWGVGFYLDVVASIIAVAGGVMAVSWSYEDEEDHKDHVDGSEAE